MEIPEAYDRTHDGAQRPSIIDEFRAKIVELVERSQGPDPRGRGHERLVALKFNGSDRTTRRAMPRPATRSRQDRGVYRP